jgi:hypothetical protein
MNRRRLTAGMAVLAEPGRRESAQTNHPFSPLLPTSPFYGPYTALVNQRLLRSRRGHLAPRFAAPDGLNVGDGSVSMSKALADDVDVRVAEPFIGVTLGEESPPAGIVGGRRGAGDRLDRGVLVPLVPRRDEDHA